jgi:hypothetical protein
MMLLRDSRARRTDLRELFRMKQRSPARRINGAGRSRLLRFGLRWLLSRHQINLQAADLYLGTTARVPECRPRHLYGDAVDLR